MSLNKECMSPDGTIPGQPDALSSHPPQRGRAPSRGTGACRYDQDTASAEDEQFVRMALDEARHGDLPLRHCDRPRWFR